MGTLSFRNDIFYFEPSENLDHNEASLHGLIFDTFNFHYLTRSPLKAVKLRRFADSSAEQKFKKYFITDLAPPESIIYPDHLAPRTWQIESAWWALTRTPSYIADEAGLGKTATAIMALNSAPGKTLVICPPYLRFNWANEIKRWILKDELGCPHTAIVEKSSQDQFFLESGIIVLPDSLLTHARIRSLLKKKKFKWLIVDEAHRYKTAESQRTKALLGDEKNDGITALAERTIFLSGTPTPNGRPIELYPVLSLSAPQSIQHRGLEEYWKDFCGGKSVTHYERGQAIIQRDLQGASHLKKLRHELREKFMIRHLKKNCLKELGPKTRQIIFLDAPKSIQQFEKKILKARTLDEILGDDFKLGDIARYRKVVGLAKMMAALTLIEDFLGFSNEKLVVSAYHIQVVEFLAAQLVSYGALKIRGGMTAKMKNEQVKVFQTNPACRVIVGNTLSMGLGNTLTKASTLIVVEPEWVSGVNEQMEDRIHRISQDKHVLCKYLVLRNSLDEVMLRRALGKEDNIEMVMN